jgi:hypothetical protein
MGCVAKTIQTGKRMSNRECSYHGMTRGSDARGFSHTSEGKSGDVNFGYHLIWNEANCPAGKKGI